MRKEVINWLKQADHDLAAAGKNIEFGVYDVAAFLCQQAVEKYLKALYIEKFSKSPPRIHYLDQLARMLELDGLIIGQAKELTDDYMISRYPDVTSGAPYEEYDQESVKKKLEVAKAMVQRIKELLNCYE